MKKINIPFYLIMLIGLITSTVFSILEFTQMKFNSGCINLIVSALFILIILHKYLKDKEMGKAIIVLNWVILLFVFIGIAAESGVLFKL